MNIFFWVGVFLIPFDNLSIAPSRGWAAISPYIFLLYCLGNIKASLLIVSNIAFNNKWYVYQIGGFFSIYTLICWVIYGANFGLMATDASKLFLGFAFYVALSIISMLDQEWPLKFVRTISAAYFLALIFGISQFVLIKTGIGFPAIYEILFSRYYANKIQFSFTEPSFTSLHVCGVIFLTAYFFDKIGIEVKKLIYIGLAICLISVFSGSSLRMLIDFTVVLFSYVVLEKRKINKSIIYLLIVIFSQAMFMSIYFSDNVYIGRINSLLGFSDVSAAIDPSREIREFRAMSAVYGAAAGFGSLIFGVGSFNVSYAMEIGYDRALINLPEIYTEVRLLLDVPDGLTYSMIVKWFSEYGILGLSAILLILLRGANLFPFVIIIVTYLQFDSYAFYSLWIYLFMRDYNSKRLLVGNFPVASFQLGRL